MTKFLDVGDRVKVIVANQPWESTLAKKEGIFWRLTQNHPKDCCNYWTEDQIILLKKR